MGSIRRRSTALSTPSYKLSRPNSPLPLSCPSEVKMGDGRHSPTDWMAHYPPSSNCSRSPAKPEFAFDDIPVSTYSSLSTYSSGAKLGTSWWNKLFAIFSIVSAFYTGKHMNSTKKLVRSMEREMREMKLSLEKTQSSQQEAQRVLSGVKVRRAEAQELNQKLQHEVKMIEAMKEEGVDMHAPNGERTLQTWMNDRQIGLRRHWHTLRRFLQNQSRDALIDRFGMGPYHVEIAVEIQTNSRVSSHRKFTVEMASMFDVPHSVYFFLDTVEKKLWDDTVFLHHEQVDHVLAAVPLEYQSQSIKQEGLQKLELQTLAFPEYSPTFPHEKYTLGFANLGPTFYINTADNRKSHGPGGQDHHLLPDDADPCFARVIEGVDVVDDLVKYGLASKNRVDPNGKHPWAGTDHMWSRIVSLRILPPSSTAI